nr:MAG TPA_asm: hypothetical protein [Caudoviricetes sp.]
MRPSDPTPRSRLRYCDNGTVQRLQKVRCSYRSDLFWQKPGRFVDKLERK